MRLSEASAFEYAEWQREQDRRYIAAVLKAHPELAPKKPEPKPKKVKH